MQVLSIPTLHRNHNHSTFNFFHKWKSKKMQLDVVKKL